MINKFFYSMLLNNVSSTKFLANLNKKTFSKYQKKETKPNPN